MKFNLADEFLMFSLCCLAFAIAAMTSIVVDMIKG